MLKIQVLGSGMIPRLNVIAPRKEPFMADLNWITLILSTPGLEINYINPMDNSIHGLDRTNFREVYEKFENVDYDHSKKLDLPEEPQQAPVVPEEKFESAAPDTVRAQETGMVEEKTEEFSMQPIIEPEKNEEVVEEKEDEFEMAPISNESNNQNYNNGGKKKNKHNR
nr:MAG TPA: hypothetical protein [Caudoviricetes sp.]